MLFCNFVKVILSASNGNLAGAYSILIEANDYRFFTRL